MRNYFFPIFLLVTISLGAQTTTFSPYSFYGIGLLQPRGGVFSQSMGGLSQGISNGNFINTGNPASYAFNQKVNFEFNIFYRLNTLQDSVGYYDYRTYNFSRMNLAFPLGKKGKSGACIGIMPYSTSGYTIQRKFADPTPHSDFYNGSGGINKLFGGAGFNVTKNIALGANMNYLFGYLNKVRSTIFDSAYINNYYLQNKTTVRGLSADLSAQFRHTIDVTASKNKLKRDSVNRAGNKRKKIYTDTVTVVIKWGVTYSTAANANAGSDVYGVTFKSFSFPINDKNIIPKDTVKYSIDERGKIFLPGSLGLGFTVYREHKKDHSHNLLLGADLNYSNWSNYSNFGNVDSLHRSYSLRAGGSYKPNKSNLNGYFNYVEYRAGFHYTKTPIEVRSTAINEYGLAIGLGLPIVAKMSSSRTSGILNIGLEAGRMGTLQNNLTTDTYFKVSLGLNLTSSDWFHRYKYD
jgi:hypothetical protein